KKVQVEFINFSDSNKDLQDLLYNSLYTEVPIVEYAYSIANKNREMLSAINYLHEIINDKYPKLQVSFMKLYYAWFQINTDYYTPTVEQFKDFSSPVDTWIPLISNHGLAYGLDIAKEQQKEGLGDDKKLKEIEVAIENIELHIEDDPNFIKLQEQLQSEIDYLIVVNIANNALFLVLFISAIVIMSILMSMRISTNLISKIHNVESSLQKISDGDLTTQVVDVSDDEFTLLANSFNTLTSMLLSKTASMKAIMNEISEIISEDMNMDALMIKIVELAKQSSKADAATLLLVDKFTDVLRVEYTDGFFPPPYSVSISVKSKRSLIMEKFKSTPIAFHSCYLAKDSVLKGHPLFIKDTEIEGGEMPLNSNPQDIQFIKSSMTIPLVVSNKLLGVISLAKTNRDEIFSDLDYSNLVSFVEYVSLTIDNIYKYLELLEKSEMKREMDIASEIQKQLLPKKIPVINNVDISAFSESAKGISGDYYDVYKISGTKSVATVCDVAGKGVAAALVLVIIRTILHLASHSKSTSKDLLNFLNKSISDRVKTDNIATLTVLIYDSETNKINISIAGDTPILIYRNKKNVVERVSHSDIPVGIDTTTVYEDKEIHMDEDDVLYMFSDGLLEVRNDFNDIFSIDELEAFILEHSRNRTETISVLLKNYIDEFRGSHARVDDETVVIFKKI
ncbi:MAG: SpoIIE family protein phosphatase, partial [Spirochaetales bacterium]|nr:SpoIIE family protein phosphatase [Spirochaetales bacterium]